MEERGAAGDPAKGAAKQERDCEGNKFTVGTHDKEIETTHYCGGAIIFAGWSRRSLAGLSRIVWSAPSSVAPPMNFCHPGLFRDLQLGMNFALLLTTCLVILLALRLLANAYTCTVGPRSLRVGVSGLWVVFTPRPISRP